MHRGKKAMAAFSGFLVVMSILMILPADSVLPRGSEEENTIAVRELHIPGHGVKAKAERIESTMKPQIIVSNSL